MVTIKGLIAKWNKVKNLHRGPYSCLSVLEQAGAIMADGYWTLSKVRALVDQENQYSGPPGYWTQVWAILEEAMTLDNHWHKTPEGWAYTE